LIAFENDSDGIEKPEGEKDEENKKSESDSMEIQSRHAFHLNENHEVDL
jgi:hypothetical protein